MSDAIAPPARLLPEMEPETTFFWQSGADGCLRIGQCAECGRYQHPPFPRCPACGSEAMSPAIVSGKGRVASFTINHEPWIPGLRVPYVYAAVELAEQRGLYVFTNIVAPVDAVGIGMPVEVCFEQYEDVWLPLFRPAEHARG